MPTSPETTPTASPQGGAIDEEIWLLGQPPISDYLDYVRDVVVGGSDERRSALVEEWNRANDYYESLEDLEPGIADQVECRPLDPVLGPLVEEVTGDPRFRKTFDTLPTTFGMVELDKLVVFQNSVTGNFVDSLKSRLGPNPSPEALFRLCLPLGESTAKVEMRRVGSRRFEFRSESMDLRFHEAAQLAAEQVAGYQSFGPIAGIVGLVVGMGSNFLNVIRVGKRLLLHNGYHRSCALRSLGITHAPAIIQTVTRPDELGLVAKSVVSGNPDFYFRSFRPPLIKDFFDPKIAKSLRVHKQVRTIEVSFEVKDVVTRG